jgi:hypothetical protein
MPSPIPSVVEIECDLILTCIRLEPYHRHELGELLLDLPFRKVDEPNCDQLAELHREFVYYAGQERGHEPWCMTFERVLGIPYRSDCNEE